jgi:hypothetical protein
MKNIVILFFVILIFAVGFFTVTTGKIPFRNLQILSFWANNTVLSGVSTTTLELSRSVSRLKTSTTLDTQKNSTSSTVVAPTPLIPTKINLPVATEVKDTELVITKYTAPSDWGKVTTRLGFSFRYPSKEASATWGDDGDFQVYAMLSPMVVTSNETQLHEILDDLQALHLIPGLEVIIFKDKTSDLGEWNRKYNKQERGNYGEKILSENSGVTTFAGEKGIFVSRIVEVGNTKFSFKFRQNEIVIKKDEMIYRFAYIGAVTGSVLPRAGETGNRLLVKSEEIAKKILGTFAFDGSNAYTITVPKSPLPPLSGGDRTQRDKLLTALRTGPFYDEKVFYPPTYDPCSSEESSGSTNVNILQSPSDVAFKVDESDAEIHGYNAVGEHTGALPYIPIPGGFSYNFPEQMVHSMDISSFGSSVYLSVSENIDGKIMIRGKKYGFTQLSLTRDGNSCDLVDLQLPITPYSEATIPMTTKGDLGPISIDLDGDEKEDMEISLLHPLLPQKMLDAQNVIGSMMSTWPEKQ